MSWRWLVAILLGLPVSMVLSRLLVIVLPAPEEATTLAVLVMSFPLWVGLMALAFAVQRGGAAGGGRAARLRRFLHLHTWVGLLAGMALFIAFYAGAITVFAEELHHWERQPAPTAVQAPAEANALVDAFRAAHPEARDFWLMLATPGEPRHALHWDTTAPDGRLQEREFVLDDDGRLRADAPLPGLVEFLFRLHYTAGLPEAWGGPLLGVLSLLYGLALVSGVVVYAPQFLGNVFALRRGRNPKRTWQDLHNVVGVLSLPFHVVFAWTGALLGIGLLVVGLYQPLFGGRVWQVLQADFELVPPVADSGNATPLLGIPELLSRAQAAAPDVAPASMSFSGAGDRNATVAIYGDFEGRTLGQSAGVALNAADGRVLRIDTPQNDSPGNTLLRGLLALHYANFGPMALKWLYFLLALAGALVFYTGNLMWIEARRRRRNPGQPARTLWLARLTVGVCIGCIAGISAAMVAEHALPPGLANRVAWQGGIYYAVFASCVLACLASRPAVGAFGTLAAASALTLLVPVVDLVLGAGWTGQGAGSRMGVDLVAMGLSGGLALAARAVRRRAGTGPANSVWAGPAVSPEADPLPVHQP